MESNYVIIAGYNGSGSSAVTDLLKEYSGFYECGAEIRFITDPYGIIQLEEALTGNWDWIRSTVAIFDYLDYCKKLVRKKSNFPFARFGMGYSDTINKDFYKITEEYISDLTDGFYYKDFYSLKAKKTYVRYVIDRIRYGIEVYSHGKIKLAKSKKCFFSYPSSERFSLATKKYIDCLFAHHFKEEKVHHVILDQALMPRDAFVLHRYFNNAKMIIVDRDPRDMYADELVVGASINAGITKRDGEIYAMRQLALRDKQLKDDAILKLRFEDLVLNYDNAKSKICYFLGIDESTHIFPFKYLKPDVSQKNIGFWKKYYNDAKDAFDAISSIMSEYFYGN